MAHLDHWKADELRAMAASFRDQAQRTRLEKYVELLSHTAEELEHEAEVLDDEAPVHAVSSLGRVLDLYA